MQTPKHVVGLSGGKDSTAMALRLAELYPRRNWEFICNETGDELPSMVAHWDRLEKILSRPIVRVRHERGLIDECRKQRMLPSTLARWCTRVLKIEPTIAYMDSLPSGSVLYVGLRHDEEDRKGLYGDDVQVVFPMREWGWSEDDVWAYLESRQVCIPQRTDCALCPYQRLGEWRNLLNNHPDLYQRGIDLEDEIGATIRSPGRDKWPADLRSLRVEFESGRKLRRFNNKNKCRVCSL